MTTHTETFPRSAAASMAASFGALRPVINITVREPNKRRRKFARVVFPAGVVRKTVEDTLARFPDALGYACDLRQIGPDGFSLPLELAEVPVQ